MRQIITKQQCLAKYKDKPEKLLEYALHVLQTLWPEAEPFIIKDPLSASQYAKYLIYNT